MNRISSGSDFMGKTDKTSSVAVHRLADEARHLMIFTKALASPLSANAVRLGVNMLLLRFSRLMHCLPSKAGLALDPVLTALGLSAFFSQDRDEHRAGCAQVSVISATFFVSQPIP